MNGSLYIVFVTLWPPQIPQSKCLCVVAEGPDGVAVALKLQPDSSGPLRDRRGRTEGQKDTGLTLLRQR